MNFDPKIFGVTMLQIVHSTNRGIMAYLCRNYECAKNTG